MEPEESFKPITFSALELLGSPVQKKAAKRKQKGKQKSSAPRDIYDSDSDEGISYGFRQALPVADGEPDFSQEEPLTADEYLKRVRWEAKQQPKTLCSTQQHDLVEQQIYKQSIPIEYMVPTCPQFASLDPEWVKRFCTDFGSLREDIQRYELPLSKPQHIRHPGVKDVSGWRHFLYGPKRGKKLVREDIDENKEMESGNQSEEDEQIDSVQDDYQMEIAGASDAEPLDEYKKQYNTNESSRDIQQNNAQNDQLKSVLQQDKMLKQQLLGDQQINQDSAPPIQQQHHQGQQHDIQQQNFKGDSICKTPPENGTAQLQSVTHDREFSNANIQHYAGKYQQNLPQDFYKTAENAFNGTYRQQDTTTDQQQKWLEQELGDSDQSDMEQNLKVNSKILQEHTKESSPGRAIQDQTYQQQNSNEELQQIYHQKEDVLHQTSNMYREESGQPTNVNFHQDGDPNIYGAAATSQLDLYIDSLYSEYKHVYNEGQVEAIGQGHHPSSSTILSLDQVQTLFLIKTIITDLCAPSTLTFHQCAWLFALFARVEQPLDYQTVGNIRDLFRYCSTKRSELSSPEDPLLPMLNMLITISGAYFRQDKLLAGYTTDH